MKWIDKSKDPYKADADAVVLDFLNNCCLNAHGRYENIRYDKKRDSGHNPCFCSAEAGSYRKRFTQILVDSQDGYCCYCMRKLKTYQVEDSDELITREHIIPRAYSIAETPHAKILFYQQCLELSPDKVVMTDHFEDSSHDQSNDLPPFPHKVAYNNIVASCNGTFPYVRNGNMEKSKICCNEYRKEKEAYPVYFIRGIEGMIDYRPSGDIQALHSIDADCQQKITTVIANANLDCDPLKDIRHLWYLLSGLPKERIYSCNTESKRDRLFTETLYKTSLFENDRTSHLHENFMKEDFWNTFMLYDYFYDVFSKMHQR